MTLVIGQLVPAVHLGGTTTTASRKAAEEVRGASGVLAQAGE